ncbi:DNA-3-methyladenine glycosylase [Herbiconiux sp. A18JL235]|uniref:DNA-3-methyladenine glycosylase n=1 Tax=Herbiconiux sp. A18JL235 TaxID=3152363 RepID=A0AB39BCI6_9MICO
MTLAASDRGVVEPSGLMAHYEPRRPVDLGATLGHHRRGAGDPCFAVEGGSFWLTLRTVAGTATLRLSPTPSGVRAEAWGDGAGEALHSVPELLGEGDDWSELDVSAHPLLSDSAHRNPGLRLSRTGRVLDALAPAVIEQRITSVEAFRAWRVLVARHGEEAPGPGPARLRVSPTAAAWKRIPSWEWHRAGVDPGRAATVIRAAGVAAGLERTAVASRGGTDVWRRLRSVVGVGEWTAAETAQRAHGDPDAVSFGDYHLASTVGWALCGEPVDDDALAELLEPWRGQRQRVVRLVLASGFRPPRRGPRMTIQDHRTY